MKFLVIGLGSMGKRRVRCLQALGYSNVAGFDIKNERLEEAAEKYDIKVFDNFEKAVEEFAPDAFIISTSPELHMQYAFEALRRSIHCFIEASVVEDQKILELHKKVLKSGLVFAPSCTMRYFPGPKKVKELIEQKAIGRILNINYQTGQYLPDWHPWEDIKDFYVSKRETGAAKEIVPFELTWLNDIFGNPEALSLVKRKLSDMDADIDDIYHCLLSYPENIIGNLTVEVLSRPEATRELRILGDKGTLVFSAYENVVRYKNIDMDEWKCFNLGSGTVEEDYINPEEPYIDEIRDFTKAVVEKNPNLYPNDLHADYMILQNLIELELLAK